MVPIKQYGQISGRPIISIINTLTENLGQYVDKFFTLTVHTTLNTYVTCRDISETHNENRAFPTAINVCLSIMMYIPYTYMQFEELINTV